MRPVLFFLLLFFFISLSIWKVRWGSLPVRKARLSSSVHFVSTRRGGRTRPSASRTPARTPLEPDASGRQTGRKRSHRRQPFQARFSTLLDVLRFLKVPHFCRIYFIFLFTSYFPNINTSPRSENRSAFTLVACSIFQKVFAKLWKTTTTAFSDVTKSSDSTHRDSRDSTTKL